MSVEIKSLIPERSPEPVIGRPVTPTLPTQDAPVIPTVRRQVMSEPMDFYDAIRATLLGKRVRKLSWEDQDIYAVLHDTMLKLHEKNVLNAWSITDGDIVGLDWVVVG